MSISGVEGGSRVTALLKNVPGLVNTRGIGFAGTLIGAEKAGPFSFSGIVERTWNDISGSVGEEVMLEAAKEFRLPGEQVE